MKKIFSILKKVISYNPYLYSFIKNIITKLNNKNFFIPLNIEDFNIVIRNKKYFNLNRGNFERIKDKYNYFLIFKENTISKYQSDKLEKLFDLIKKNNADVAYDGCCSNHTEIVSKKFLENYSSKHSMHKYPYRFFYVKKDYIVKNIGSEHRSYNFNGTFKLPSGGETIGDSGNINFRLSFIPDLTSKTFLDIGSEEGYSVFNALKKNATYAKGINIKESSEYDSYPEYLRPKEITSRKRAEIDKTQAFLIKEFKIKEINKIKFDYQNIYNLGDEKFDFVFCFGVLYHLKNPYKALENLFSITKETLVIETQGIKNSSYLNAKIEEGDGFVRHSPNALKFLLQKVGFKKVEILVDAPHKERLTSIILKAEKN